MRVLMLEKLRKLSRAHYNQRLIDKKRKLGDFYNDSCYLEHVCTSCKSCIRTYCKKETIDIMQEFEHPVFIAMNSLVDLFFFVDIIVAFKTSYMDAKKGEEVIDSMKIARRYMLGRFWIDILAVIPVDYIAEVSIIGFS